MLVVGPAIAERVKASLAGHECEITVESVAEAQHDIKTGAYDMLIVDAECKAGEFLKQIRAYTKSTPVVFTSSFGTDVQEAIASGPVTFTRDPEELGELVGTCVRENRRVRTL